MIVALRGKFARTFHLNASAESRERPPRRPAVAGSLPATLTGELPAFCVTSIKMRSRQAAETNGLAARAPQPLPQSRCSGRLSKFA
jgi:hypothetical protein